jgi:phage terminase large subunit-like protein
VYRDYIGEIAQVSGGGKILRMATKASTMHGYNPSLGIVDELHAWTAPSMRSAFGAMMTAGGARKRTQMFVITTAGEGHERETSILGMLVDRNEADGDVELEPGLTISRNHAARTLVYNYSAPTMDPFDVAAMKLANPASWITESYLERQAADPSLSVAQVLQLHGCVWASSEDAFVSLERWRELADADAGTIAPGASVCVGFDGSRTYDTTVAAWASMLPDGRIAVKSHVWSTRRDAPHHELTPGEIDFARFEEYVASELFGRFKVVEGAYDPRYLIRSVQLLRDRLPGSRIAEVEPMSKLMRDALATFYQLVVDGRIVHDGDPVLAAHVAAAKAEQDEKGWIVRKRHQSKPIDALIATVLAVWRCSLVGNQRTPFYMEWE